MSKKDYIELATICGLALRNDWSLGRFIDEIESFLIANNDRFNSAKFRAYIEAVRIGEKKRGV